MSTSFKMKRAWRRWISAVAAVVLLFAQLSIAAYACPNFGNAPRAGASTVAERGDQPRTGLDPEHPSVCHEHCKAQVSAEHAPIIGVPPAMPSGLLVVVVDVHHFLTRARYAAPDPAQANGPPRSILFCVFRT